MPSTLQLRAQVRAALVVVINDFGSDVAAAPDRLRALLADVVGKDAVAARAEIAALVAAAQAGIPEELRHRGAGGSASDGVILGRLADVGLDGELAGFVVDAWANALGVPGLLESTTPVGSTQPNAAATVLPGDLAAPVVDLGLLAATELPDGAKAVPGGTPPVDPQPSWYRRLKIVVPVAVASFLVVGSAAAAVALGGSSKNKTAETVTAVPTPSVTVTPTPSPTPSPRVTAKPKAKVTKKAAPVLKKTTAPATNPQNNNQPAPVNPAPYVPPVVVPTTAPRPVVTTPPAPPKPVRVRPTADNFGKAYVPDVLQNGACVLNPSGPYSWGCGYPVTVWGHGDWTYVNIVGVAGGSASSTGRGFTFTPAHNGPFTGYVYYTLVDGVSGNTSNTGTVTFTVQQNPNIPPGQ